MICLIVVLLIPDETLSPEAVAWLEPPIDTDPENNIYIGLLGLGVAEDKDFIQEGIKIGDEVNRLIIEYQKTWVNGVEISEEETMVRFHQITSLTESELDITFKKEQLCIPSEKQCLSFWKREFGMINDLVQNNQVLLNRTHSLKKLTHVTNTTTPDLVTP